MAEPFSAAAAFTNSSNNNTDGWGDDWGDWGDNSATMSQPKAPQQAPQHPGTANQYFQQQQQYQPHPQQPQPQQTSSLDQSNKNFMMNSLQSGKPHPQQYPSYGQQATTGGNLQTPYQHAPSYQQQQQNYYPPQSSTPYGQQPPAPMSYFTQAPLQQATVEQAQSVAAAASPPLPYPPTSGAPHLPGPPPPPPVRLPSGGPAAAATYNQTISDSFNNTTSNDSWNWSGFAEAPSTTNHQSVSLPGAGSNTQQPSSQAAVKSTPPVLPEPAQLARIRKTETLSPQWSIESQVSQTSCSTTSSGGNRSLDELSRSSNTGPSDDGDGGAPLPVKVDNYENISGRNYDAPDKLDEALNALNIKQEASQEDLHEHQQQQDNYRESSFPPPPPSIATQSVPPSKSSSKTPPLPPPPASNTNPGNPPQPGTGSVPFGNPFKRGAGQRPQHVATPGLSFYQQQQASAAVIGPPPPLAASIEPATTNVENLESMPENLELPGPPVASIAAVTVGPQRRRSVENQEYAAMGPPSNDRNQYLQTGHLSEEGGFSNATTEDNSYPPPGLSRYVPGEQQQQQQPQQLPLLPSPQQQQHQQQTSNLYPEPPPGLDRMIPGTDLENASELNFERQADGEVSDTANSSSAVAARAASNFSSQHHHYHHHHHHHQLGDGGPTGEEEEHLSDRNRYLVPGDETSQQLQQPQQQQTRVIPGGVEQLQPPGAATAGGHYPHSAASATSTVMDIPISEQQRELVMDGENPHDPPPTRVVASSASISTVTSSHDTIAPRQEPIEGGNTLDLIDDEPSGVLSGASESMPDSNQGLVAATAEQQQPPPPANNTSTADDSDKGAVAGYYGKGRKPIRRGGGEESGGDPLRRSMKSKSSRDRYDTEDSDYSDRERRRRERESSGGERRRGGGEREKDKEQQRRKDGGSTRDRDYDYRDRDRNRYERDRDRDRYGRGSNKYDRESRYETDGSKYETERSARYDKEGDGSKQYISREDYYRKREGQRGGGGGGDDRRYRKEHDRGSDRYRDERRKDDRYREQGGGGEKRREHRSHHDRRYDYDEYRASSRNGTERDRGDRMRDSRERDGGKDPRDRKYLAASSSAYGVAPAYSSTGYYDAYSYYQQHQQYYEQLRRTNPQAYAEWYRTYIGQMQAVQMQRDLLTSDGRESVHSGRSSANEKDRFNRTTPFLHHQPPPHGMYNAEDYHRHFNNQSQPSAALLDQSFLCAATVSEASGQPTSLPPLAGYAPPHQLHPSSSSAAAHALTSAYQQQQQLLQQRATPLMLDRSYHLDSGYYQQPRLETTEALLRKTEADVSSLAQMEPERLTPRKFPEIHPIVSISSGLLVLAKNRLTSNGTADVVKLFSLGVNDSTRKLFQSYPGPLAKEKTHKKSVIEFCEEQLRQGPPASLASGQMIIKSRGNSVNSLNSLATGGVNNRGSYTLLWNYIILLLRQNGTFVGTDISELLMQNKVEFPFEVAQQQQQHGGIRSVDVSGRNSSLSTSERKYREADADEGGKMMEPEEHQSQAEAAQEEGNNSSATTANAELPFEGLLERKPTVDEQLSEAEITEKFRNYLIYGNIADALEWATERNLWGHALFLASKVDSRQHANVMMKFANKLALNDPLQTLYQLLSGRTPSAVSCVLDERWGDWRPHLAMLMSNSSAKPELIKKSITTLGDSLSARGDLYGSHFCYLLSDVSFGKFADVKLTSDSGVVVGKDSPIRLILLGSSHAGRTFAEFATNEAIMMTEIYEYARSLSEERYSITELQFYKYVLAIRMLDYGMQLKCLLYMEQIAEQILLDPYRFDASFIKQVYALGDRLKYYDPVLEKALIESEVSDDQGNSFAHTEDPAWLQRLGAIMASYDTPDNRTQQQQSSLDATHDASGAGYVSHGNATTSQQEPSYDGQAVVDSTDINKQFTEINQQIGQLNMQYVEGYDAQPPLMQQQQQPHSSPVRQSYDNQLAAPSYDQGYDSINHSSLPDDSHQHQQQQQQHQPQDSYGQQHQYSYGYDASASGQPNLFVPSQVGSQEAQGSYDYWGAASNEQTSKPMISMPNAVSSRPGYGDDEDNERSTQLNQTSGMGQSQKQQQQQSQQAGLKSNVQSKSISESAKTNQSAKDSKAGANQNSNSGWFGGIWNKFSLKPKNQMILPDDKNPTIVWDPEKKRWVNTEGDDEGGETFKPPPKMTDLTSPNLILQQQQQQQAAAAATQAAPSPMGGYGQQSGGATEATQSQPPAIPKGGNTPGTIVNSQQHLAAAAPASATPKLGEPTKVPTLQSNMFKMQRNRTLKKSYVDVFNQSGASRPAEPILAPSVPAVPTQPGGFFVPGAAPPGSQSSDSRTETGAPQFYNPNQFSGGGGGGGYQE